MNDNDSIVPRIPIGEWGGEAIAWINDNFEWLLDFISLVLDWSITTLIDALLVVPALVMIALFALLGLLVRSWEFAVGTVLTFLLIIAMDQWTFAMQTLALVLIATVVAVIIAVPIGIVAARSDRVSAVVRPVLDFMQTMPAFVYLLPAVVFFGIGFVPGLFATVIFALPPGVRLTELGIRGVDAETVEAGQAFGATPGQILRGIQIPLATPTIMAGVNQVIMLALSMAVIAGIAGADGLGKEVVQSIATLDRPQGIEAGLGVVIIAIYLDRLTASLGRPGDYPHSLLGRLRSRSGGGPDRDDDKAGAEARDRIEGGADKGRGMAQVGL